MRRAIALLDWFLLSRHGRRLRRWSFLVTVPVAVVAALVVGIAGVPELAYGTA